MKPQRTSSSASAARRERHNDEYVHLVVGVDNTTLTVWRVVDKGDVNPAGSVHPGEAAQR
jgi:hypothetical protein